MTATMHVVIFAHGEQVETGPDSEPIKARVLRATVLPGGLLRYELGYWLGGAFITNWFPASEVRPHDD